VEEHVGVTVERVIVDGAYAERPENPVDLISPMLSS
jgi:hypothetical protein